MNNEDNQYDVIIVGGGPGGSTVATMLAREGHKVLVLEKQKFPRFHIGESLTAFAPDALKKLGVYEELNKINYVKKRGMDFIFPDKTEHIDFPEGEIRWAFQMTRAKFDTVLLQNSKKSGAIIKEQHLVKDIIFDGEQVVGVSYKDVAKNNNAIKRAYAKWVVDASGQSGLVNKYYKDNCYNDFLLDDKIAVFSHWQGDIGITNKEEDINFKLCVHPNRKDWAWFIPLDKDLVSIGVVVDKDSFKNKGKNIEQIFKEVTSETPFIKDFLKNKTLKRAEKLQGIKSFSYRSKNFYGKGWVLTGDAAGFLDPIFSSGLQITFNGGFKLAEALNKLLKQKEFDETPLKIYQNFLTDAFRLNSTLTYRFYRTGIDIDLLKNHRYMAFHTKWANPIYALRSLWYGLQLITEPHQKIANWGREVLFASCKPGNKIGKLFLVLAENYEKLNERKIKKAKPRQEYIEQQI